MKEFEQDVLAMIVNRAEYSLSAKERNDLVKNVNSLVRDISSKVRLAGWSQGKNAASTRMQIDASQASVADYRGTSFAPPQVNHDSLDITQRAQLAIVIVTFAPWASEEIHDSLMVSCERYVAGIAARSYLSGWNEGFDSIPGKTHQETSEAEK